MNTNQPPSLQATFITLEPSRSIPAHIVKIPEDQLFISLRVLPSNYSLARNEVSYNSQTGKTDPSVKSSVKIFAINQFRSLLLEDIDLSDLSRNYFISFNSEVSNKSPRLSSLIIMLSNVRLSFLLYTKPREQPVEHSSQDPGNAKRATWAAFLEQFKLNTDLTKKFCSVEKIPKNLVLVKAEVADEHRLPESQINELFKLCDRLFLGSPNFPLPKKISKKEHYSDLKSYINIVSDLNTVADLLNTTIDDVAKQLRTVMATYLKDLDYFSSLTLLELFQFAFNYGIADVLDTVIGLLKNENSKLYLSKAFINKLAELGLAVLSKNPNSFFSFKIALKKKYLLYLEKLPSYSAGSHLDTNPIANLIKAVNTVETLTNYKTKLKSYIAAFTKSIEYHRTIVNSRSALEIEQAAQDTDLAKDLNQRDRSYLYDKFRFAESLLKVLAELNKEMGLVDEQPSLSSMAILYGKIVSKLAVESNQAFAYAGKSFTFHYDPAVIHGFGLIIADAELSNMPILNHIIDELIIYIKKLSQRFGALNLHHELDSLKAVVDRLKDQERFGKLYLCLSQNDDVVKIQKQLQILSAFHEAVYTGLPLSSFSIDELIYEIEQALEYNQFLRNIFYSKYANDLALICLQILCTYNGQLTDILSTVDHLFESKLKAFDPSFTELSYKVRDFIFANEPLGFIQNLESYFGHKKLFGVPFEKPLPLRQVLELSTFNDFKNSIIFEEFKKHAVHLSNQEFSLEASGIAQNFENYSNFKTRILDNFITIYQVNYGLSRVLKGNEATMLNFDYNSCLKLFNFLSGYGYATYFVCLSQSLRHQGTSLFIRSFPLLVDNIFEIINAKLQLLSGVPPKERLEIKVTNVCFFESLFRIYLLQRALSGIDIHQMSLLQQKIHVAVTALANNISVEAFCSALISALLYNSDSYSLLEILFWVLKEQYAAKNSELCDLLFKSFKSEGYADTLSFNYDDLVHIAALDFDSKRFDSFWSLLFEIFLQLDFRDLYYSRNIIETLLNFNQIEHIAAIYETIVARLTRITDALELSADPDKSADLLLLVSHIYKVLYVSNICFGFVNFKSYGLSRKITDLFIRSYKCLSSHKPMPHDSAMLRDRALYVNLNVILVLSNVQIGIRAYIGQKKQIKAVLEDIPIESHVKRIFDMVAQENFSIESLESSTTFLETRVILLEIFYEFMTHSLGKNLMLQLIDTSHIIFRFSDFFDIKDVKGVSMITCDPKIRCLLSAYLSLFVKTLNLFSKIDSNADAKCICTIAGVPVASRATGENSTDKKYASKIQAVLDKIGQFNYCLFDARMAGHSDIDKEFVQRSLKIMKDALLAKRKKFKDLEKKIKYDFQDIMPDEFEQRLALASEYPASFDHKKTLLKSSIKKFDLPVINKLVTQIYSDANFSKSFNMNEHDPRLKDFLGVDPLPRSKYHGYPIPAFKALKLKISSLVSIFNDSRVWPVRELVFEIPAKIGRTIIYKEEDPRPTPQSRHQQLPSNSANNPYLVFNTKKIKGDQAHKQEHHHKLHRTNTHLGQTASHLASNPINPTNQDIYKLLNKNRQGASNLLETGNDATMGGHLHSYAFQGVVNTGSNVYPGSGNLQNSRSDVINPHSQMISKPEGGMINPSKQSFESSIRNFDNSYPRNQRHRRRQEPRAMQQDLQPFPNALLSMLGQPPTLSTDLQRPPHHSRPRSLIPNVSSQSQGMDEASLGKRPALQYPTHEVMQHYHSNPLMGPSYPFVPPNAPLPFINPMLVYPGFAQNPATNLPYIPNRGFEQGGMKPEFKGDPSASKNLSGASQADNPELLAELLRAPVPMMYASHAQNISGAPEGLLPPQAFDNSQQGNRAQHQQQNAEGYPLNDLAPQMYYANPGMHYSYPYQYPVDSQAKAFGQLPSGAQPYNLAYPPHTANVPQPTPPYVYPKSSMHYNNPSPYSNPVGRTKEDSYEFSDNQFSDDEAPKTQTNRANRDALRDQQQKAQNAFIKSSPVAESQAEAEGKSFLQQLAKTHGGRFFTKQP